ncbi:hypothetical protein K1719_022262 [Acacia pycnantha]|nr:hypothetical protein K1719_022262 [Acacia pycnantha]
MVTRLLWIIHFRALFVVLFILIFFGHLSQHYFYCVCSVQNPTRLIASRPCFSTSVPVTTCTFSLCRE